MKIKVKKKINVLVLTWLSLHIAVTQGATLKSSNSTPTPQRQNNKHSDNTALHEASLLISEIFFDPTSQGQGYIELYGRGKMTLTNYSIVIYGGPHLKDVSVINLINQSAHSDGAFVIGGPDTQNVDLITNTSILQGNMTILALYKNLDKRFTNSSTYTKTGLLDYVIYGTDNVKAYETELKDFAPESPVLLKDRDEVWYSNGSFSKCYSSSSRDVRGFTITKQTPGRKNECPKVKPVINEVSISKTDDGCFVEVYTPMKRKILLNSFIIVIFMQNGTRYNMYDLWNHVTNDEGFFLLSDKGDKHSTMKINCSQSFSGAVSAVVIYQVTGNLTDFLLKLPTDFHLQNVLLFNTSNTEPKGNLSDLMSKLNQSSSYYIKNLKELQAGSVTISRCNGNFTQSVTTPGMSNICKNSSKTTLQPKSTPKPTTQPTPEPTTKTTPSTTLKPTTQPTPKLTKSTSTPTTQPTTKPTKSTPTTTTQPTPKPTKSTSTSTLKPTTQPTPKPTTNTTPNTTLKPTTQPTPKPTTKTTPNTTLKPTTQPTPKLTKSTLTPTTQPTPKPTKSTSTTTLKPTTQPTQKPTKSTQTTTLKPTTQPTPKPTTKTTPTTTLKPTTQPTPKLKTNTTPKLTTINTATETTQKTTLKPTMDITKTTAGPTNKTPKPALQSTEKTTHNSKTITISSKNHTATTQIPITNKPNDNTRTTIKVTGITPKTTEMTTKTPAQTVSSKIPTTRPHTSISVFINEINFAPNGQIKFVELNATGVFHSFQPEEYSIVIIDGTSGKKLNFITTDKGAKMNNGLFIMNHKSTAVKNFPSKSFAVALYHKQMKESDSIGDKSLVDAVIIKIDNTKMNRKVTDMMLSKASVHFDKQYVKKKYSVSRCSYKGRLDSGEFSWTKSTPNTKNAKCHERTHPNPQTDKNNDDNIKVTVAVVVSCLALFLIIVGIVVIYMKKKQKAVLQFHLARLDDYDDELITNMESVDQDDLLIGNEPTFSNNLYNKMQS